NIISVLIKMLCGMKVRDTTSGFRACNKELTAFYSMNYAQDYPEPEAIISAVLEGYRVGERPVVMEERLGGESSISSFRSAYYMIKVTISLVVYRLTIKRKRRK
ncbi:MAG: glycosyltransferase family 2 protein, partial [Oscillospiraceae bacterium]